jgi:hypothetical protein
MGSFGAQLNGVLPGLVRWACRTGTRDFYPSLAALDSPVQNIFFRTGIAHFFTSWFPFAQLPGQEVVQGRLSLNMSL